MIGESLSDAIVPCLIIGTGAVLSMAISRLIDNLINKSKKTLTP